MSTRKQRSATVSRRIFLKKGATVGVGATALSGLGSSDAEAQNFWDMRERMQCVLYSVEEAIETAKIANGAVILSDAADATSSGAPGTSNTILKGFLKTDYKGKVLFPIRDKPAVESAVAAGVGQTITVPRRQPAVRVPRNTALFFIVGPLRTGTSLLSRCIDDHPQAICLCESEINRALFAPHMWQLHFQRMHGHGATVEETLRLIDGRPPLSVDGWLRWHVDALKLFKKF